MFFPKPNFTRPWDVACIQTLADWIKDCSVQFSHSVLSDSLWHHGQQDTRLPCPSPTPGAQTHVHWVSDVIQTSHPLSPSPLAFSLSQCQVFFSESALHIRWPKYWSLSFSTSPPSEYSGLISFRIDWFNLLAVQGTLKSLLQPHNSKASILWHSAFFMVQLLHLYNYWKNHSFDYMDLCQQSDISSF